MPWKNLNDLYVPVSGGAVSGDLSVSGDLTVADSDGNSWNVGDSFTNNVLWAGNAYCFASQSITFSQAISDQAHGIALLFCAYDYDNNVSNDYSWHGFFIPKYWISQYTGKGWRFPLFGDSLPYQKYLYIYDTKIVGNNNNYQTSYSFLGQTVNQRAYVLKFVIGV